MVERVHRAERELNVALGIDVVEDFEGDIGDILYVHVFVHHHDALGEHRLAQRPDGVHHLTSLSWVRLLDGDDHQIVEDAFDGQVDVDEFGNGQFHQRQKDALDRLTHVGVFLRGLADDCGRVDWIFAVRDAGDVEDGIKIFERVEAGVVAEWALAAKFVEIHVAFEDDFAGCGDFQVDGFTFHQIDGGSAEEAGDQVFLNLGRRRNDRGKRHGRFGADGDGDFHLAAWTVAFGKNAAAGAARHDVHGSGFSVDRRSHALTCVFSRNFLTLPMHSRRTFVVDLHPVHPQIAFPRLGVARGDQGESDETPGIFGPALQDGEIEQGEIVALDDLFAGAGGHRAREELSGFRQQRKHLELVEETLGRFDIHEHADAGGDLVEGIDAERELHAGIGSELVDEELGAGMTFEILEEKCGATKLSGFARTDSRGLSPHVRFRDTVGDFGDFKDGISFGLDALQLSGAV